MNDYKLQRLLTRPITIYGDGEGLAIADDLGQCYWCRQRHPCGIDHSGQLLEPFTENLDRILAQLGLEFNC